VRISFALCRSRRVEPSAVSAVEQAANAKESLERRALEKTYSEEKLKKMSKVHNQVQAEFISTEETYVKSLELLSCKLIQPLREAVKKGVKIPQDVVSSLANNVETL
jgi:hypothetical protein